MMRRVLRKFAWLVCAAVTFIWALVFGAIFASACFFESPLTMRVVAEHFIILGASLALVVASFMLCCKCAERALES